MGGAWRWTIACGLVSLVARVLASPLESLYRERWVSLDSAATDQTTDVATGAGGGMVYISGYRHGPADADGSQDIEAVVTAYNSSGVRQWVAEYGSSGDDFGNSVAADSTGVYLAGTESVPRNSSSSSSSDGGSSSISDTDDTDAFVVKYNSTGSVLWKTSWGTSEPDLGNGVAVDDGSGRVYVVGTTRGSMSSDNAGERGGSSEAGPAGTTIPTDAAGATNSVPRNAGMSDVFLTCLNAADGEIQWTRQFGSSAADVGNRIAVGPRGGVFLVGQHGDDGDSSLAAPRAFLAKYDYLGNAQFTARLNSSSTHYAVDLAPSVGSGGEGVVYMSGYTLGDSPSVFMARFDGSTGTQMWISHLGEEKGMPHLAQSVAVVEGSQDGFSRAVGGAAEGASPGSDAEAESPVVEGAEARAGSDTRIVVVGYNMSMASADSHSSTGFTAAADTNGEWVWCSTFERTERQTAIAIGAGGGSGQAGSSGGESFAYIVGTVAASEASPGNYLFLDIQKVVRQGSPTPAPMVDPTAQAMSIDSASEADPPGGASSTTGLSQGSSLWLLIIAPIFVVLSCILMVSYVSKQCAIAFGTPPPWQEPVDPFGDDGGDGRGVRATRSFRRGEESQNVWNDRASKSPRNGSVDRRRRRDRGGDSGGASKGAREGKWSRSVAAAFRDVGSPYRTLGREQEREQEDGGEGGGEGRGREVRRVSTPVLSPFSLEDGGVELRQVTAQQHDVSFGNPAGEDRLDRGAVFQDQSLGKSGGSIAAANVSDLWDDVEDEDVGGSRHGGQSHVTGNPRGDEPPAAEVSLQLDQPTFALPSSAEEPRHLLRR